MTVHSSQGISADGVLHAASTLSMTTRQDVYYVAISRPRFEVSISTGDRSRLPAAISREQPELCSP